MLKFEIEWTKTKYEPVQSDGRSFTVEATDADEARRLATEKLRELREIEQVQYATLKSLKRIEAPENCIFLKFNSVPDSFEDSCGAMPVSTCEVSLTTSAAFASTTLYPENIINMADSNFKDWPPKIQKVDWAVDDEVFWTIREKALELKAKGFTS